MSEGCLSQTVGRGVDELVAVIMLFPEYRKMTSMARENIAVR